jgi:hypothetical protein
VRAGTEGTLRIIIRSLQHEPEYAGQACAPLFLPLWAGRIRATGYSYLFYHHTKIDASWYVPDYNSCTVIDVENGTKATSINSLIQYQPGRRTHDSIIK